jgi:hypothetical protein
MTETTFRNIFTAFLDDYWGAFHEALEAQSVTPRRLAGSLFTALQEQHRAFQAIYVGSAKTALDGLGRIWHDLHVRRYQFADPALTRAEVTSALALFGELYDSLLAQGEKFPAALKDVLSRAPHGTPREPLRADAAR